ncbi:MULTISPECIES: hypothetical protein [Bradyrhizobium]|uniref:Uncharacterized protein n=1 Tax=Bradyrhizobium ottawaense TaxID=931866 RepID=A0ABV4FIU9_9BRAD|nr:MULTISPECIES: hypothetical protein [Bradyrhizobium]MBP2435337.1 hypothetical protein [Bradyrhizobium elkanii]MCP1737498.1 hypothetical protein [Bradyrhizobium elkanii]MCS3576055.1 hypothetical protein [Bradyrhizobium elkanii]MCS3594609.1 hypothetical protein [Bradyrhizobium elkanii]MCS3625803.1 hypothetical protein [Bradyrhizobium elkanii]
MTIDTIEELRAELRECVFTPAERKALERELAELIRQRNYSATIRMRARIASRIDAPGPDRLPHLFCSWLGLRRRPGAEMAGVSEPPASSAGSRYIIALS